MHRGEPQLSPEQLLDAQPRHWSMVLDEEFVVCPRCSTPVYERKIPYHKCPPRTPGDA